MIPDAKFADSVQVNLIGWGLDPQATNYPQRFYRVMSP